MSHLPAPSVTTIPIHFRLILILCGASAQTAPQLSPLTQKYVRVNRPRVVLTHVRVIDGEKGDPRT
jgi:hypothetical protein